MLRILYLEPFDGGSHAAFTRTLTEGLDAHWHVLTLPGRHWKWRMRGAAVHFALDHREALARPYDVILASAFTPLAELRGLAPTLARTPALLYFHENQLAYPAQARQTAERDFHFGFTQLTSALAAQRCVFNSDYNRRSFLDVGAEWLARMPDAVPTEWIRRIAERSVVTGYPVLFPADGAARDAPSPEDLALGPILLWNHRWEHDKDPESFFAALDALASKGVPFRVIVCGERYRASPAVFDPARTALGSRVLHWGYAPTLARYHELLARSHVVVSTARQEFFGVSVLEAVASGARPLVPDRLA
ncbi:MAG: DUF3524 domain-containing protein, partial [Pseudomonadota bacterium]